MWDYNSVNQSPNPHPTPFHPKAHPRTTTTHTTPTTMPPLAPHMIALTHPSHALQSPRGSLGSITFPWYCCLAHAGRSVCSLIRRLLCLRDVDTYDEPVRRLK